MFLFVCSWLYFPLDFTVFFCSGVRDYLIYSNVKIKTYTNLLWECEIYKLEKRHKFYIFCFDQETSYFNCRYFKWSGGGVGGELASDCHTLSCSEDKYQ